MTTPTGNGAVLTAHEATIQTASVTIQTLRVGKKQVTMGMFRQLPYGSFVQWEAFALFRKWECLPPFHGTPWGHVNYWWPGDYEGDNVYTDDFGLWTSHGEKLHVVWQEGDRLYRSIVCARVPNWVEEQMQAKGHAPDWIHGTWESVWRTRLKSLPQLYIAV